MLVNEFMNSERYAASGGDRLSRLSRVRLIYRPSCIRARARAWVLFIKSSLFVNTKQGKLTRAYERLIPEENAELSIDRCMRDNSIPVNFRMLCLECPARNLRLDWRMKLPIPRERNIIGL
jgi:hypothetical protein